MDKERLIQDIKPDIKLQGVITHQKNYQMMTTIITTTTMIKKITHP